MLGCLCSLLHQEILRAVAIYLLIAIIVAAQFLGSAAVDAGSTDLLVVDGALSLLDVLLRCVRRRCCSVVGCATENLWLRILPSFVVVSPTTIGGNWLLAQFLF